MQAVSVTVRQAVAGSAEVAFDAVIPIDLASVFTGFGPLPAVIGTRDQIGAWTETGSTRTVLLAGGGTMAERLTNVVRPETCAYEVRPENGPLKRLVDHIEGQFTFTAQAGGGALITWTYTFVPLRGRRPAVLLLAPLWRRYATQVLARCAAAVDGVTLAH